MASTSSFADLFRGFAYPLRGIAFIRQQPDLARYWLPPIVIMFCALVLSLVLAGHYHDDLVRWLWAEPSGQDWLARFLAFLHSALEAVAFLLLAALLISLCATLSTVIAAPFNDALSEATEQRESGHTMPAFQWSRAFRDAGRSVRIELVKLLCYLAVMGPLFVLSWLVPGVGQIVYAVFGGFFTTLYFALDYIDWPASRRGHGIRQRLALVRKRPWLMLGFGAAVWMLMLIPFVNLCFMPAAVVGGTRLFRDHERAL